ncbi:MAG: hypothetical protein EHM47_03570 [Ignavibacteriales bacterium]|nr:MAG: hypothetical protein EHM47_03570 [Ignavibacteriales bacterium]
MQLIQKIFLLFLMIGICSSLWPQVRKAEFKIHDRGKLWETVKDDGTIGPADPTNRFETFPSMDWPGGPHQLNKDDQRSYNYGAGMWIGGKRGDGSTFFTENGPFTFVNEGTFEPMKEIENFLGSDNYNPNEAEEKIIADWTTTENISVTRTSRAWSFSNLNNFIIFEYVVTNKNSFPITDVFIGFPYLIRPSYQDFVVHNGWGDDFNRTDEIVKYDTSRALLYAYDDTPNFSLPSDVGNFWDDANELRTTGYAGYSMLFADAASDNRIQPANILYAQLLNNERFLNLNSTTPENLYNILLGADRSLQAQPEDRLTPFMLMSAGPYNIQPNASVKIVIVEAVDGIPISEAVKGLSAQSKLPAGLDSLRKSIVRAAQLFNNNYQLSAVPPPSPEIEIIAQPSNQSIAISWFPLEESWINPISGKSDIREYRIYRSNRSYIGPDSLIRTIRLFSSVDRDRYFDEDLNKWLYEDQGISLAAGYFYAVTSFDSAGNESWFTNRNETAIQATREAAENTLNVKVFPNPFREVSGFPTSGTENFIVWSNLPALCTIRIYTSSGELVKTLIHENLNSGEEVWDQLSNARQRTAPGIYFWTVESEVGNAKGSLLIIK